MKINIIKVLKKFSILNNIQLGVLCSEYCLCLIVGEVCAPVSIPSYKLLNAQVNAYNENQF